MRFLKTISVTKVRGLNDPEERCWMSRPSFEDFKKKALSRPTVREEYEKQGLAFERRKKRIALCQMSVERCQYP